jgi:hypothetical protein
MHSSSLIIPHVLMGKEKAVVKLNTYFYEELKITFLKIALS